jgi:hypothetical protein
MRRFWVLPLRCALVCWLAVAASSARADDIPWSYSWSGPATVGNDAGGGVKFIPVSDSGVNGMNGKLAFQLESFGPAGNIKDGTYSLTMHLVDTVSNQSADLPFAGVLNGPTNQGLLNEFTAPLTVQKTIGGNNYGVVIGLYSAPGATGSGVLGVIGTNIMVVPSGQQQQQQQPPPVNKVPEPSTLALAAVALSGLVLHWGRRRLTGKAIARQPLQ